VRVGIDISKGLGSADGIGRYSRGLVRGLIEIGWDGEVVLYPLFEPAPEGRFEEVFPDAPPNFRLAAARGPEGGEVDLFHATTHSVPVRWAGPLVFTLHDVTFLSHPHLHTLDNRLHCLTGLARAVCRGARFVAVSDNTRRECERHLDLPGERIDVVPNAADPHFRPIEQDEARRRVARRFGLAEPYVLAVGTLEPRKNLGALIAAFAALPESLRGAVRLAVAGGGGWLGVDPAEAARRAGIGDRVSVLGAVADDDLPHLYAGAEAFVYPSLYEGFGLPALEALACGAPAIVSETSSLPEVVGEAAVLIDPHDVGALRAALERVLGDAELRARLRAAGPRRAAQFSWRRTAEETAAVYRRHLAEAGAR
jgi:glycosyltransferase involved in cell wall biosynthesis